MTLKEYVDCTWHYKVEDNLGWDFCAGILGQNYSVKITSSALKNKFEKYFVELVGIKPYVKCPICDKDLLPRESNYGYFIGCSDYPRCKFIATNKKPYNKVEENKSEK